MAGSARGHPGTALGGLWGAAVGPGCSRPRSRAGPSPHRTCADSLLSATLSSLEPASALQRLGSRSKRGTRAGSLDSPGSPLLTLCSGAPCPLSLLSGAPASLSAQVLPAPHSLCLYSRLTLCSGAPCSHSLLRCSPVPYSLFRCSPFTLSVQVLPALTLCPGAPHSSLSLLRCSRSLSAQVLTSPCMLATTRASTHSSLSPAARSVHPHVQLTLYPLLRTAVTPRTRGHAAHPRGPRRALRHAATPRPRAHFAATPRTPRAPPLLHAFVLLFGGTVSSPWARSPCSGCHGALRREGSLSGRS